MDILFNLLLFIHLVALVAGGATNVVMPLIGRLLGQAGPETRAAVGPLGNVLGRNARIALATLVVSGVLMVIVRYGGVDGANGWFWLKMALVVLLLALVIFGRYLPPSWIGTRRLGLVNRVLLLGIVLAAVFAFN